MTPMTAMTELQAQQEATRRWGAGAFAICNFRRCAVGKGTHNLGAGATFEEAFADADSRRKEAVK
jgi:hypothetical protein